MTGGFIMTPQEEFIEIYTKYIIRELKKGYRIYILRQPLFSLFLIESLTRLLSDTKLFDDSTVTLNVNFNQIVKHTTTFTY